MARVMFDLRPESGSGVSGTASFESIPDGVIAKLELHELPEPDAFYLAHVHPGTCAQAGKEGEEHGASGHIEWPLSMVKSNPKGEGSSITTLRHSSIKKLFSGNPKHLNVHAVGTGNPPVLACADLKQPHALTL
jgi:hypothetical protein